ncbi:MAG: DUF4091 domain-containing protein [Spirochaetes bacterium]|nr:DUF4091 domain-containing protein [Spirochaetota bacterium]
MYAKSICSRAAIPSRRLFVAAVFVMCATVVTAEELIARWKFDGRENATVREETGKYPGIIQGNIDALRIDPALDGGAYYFEDGKAYVEVPHSEGISPLNDVTFAATIKPASVAGYCTIFWKGSRKVKPEAVSYYLNLRDGKVEFKAKKIDGNWISWVTKDACVAQDRWSVITVTFKDGVVYIAVNGNVKELNVPPDTAADRNFTALVGNEYPLYFGVAQGAGGYPAYHFRGHIDEIAFYRGTDIRIGASRAPVIACRTLASTFTDVGRDSRRIAGSLRSLIAEMALPGVTVPTAGNAPDTAAAMTSVVRMKLAMNETVNTLMPLAARCGIKLTAGTIAAEPAAAAAPETLARAVEHVAATAESLQKTVLQIADSLSEATADDTAMLNRSSDTIVTTFAVMQTAVGGFTQAATITARNARFFSAHELFAAVVVPSAQTIVQQASLFGSLEAMNGEASVSLARSEYEGLQIVLFPDPKAASAVQVRFSVNGVPEGLTVTVAPMKTVNNTKSVVPVDHRGNVFDIILDGETSCMIPTGLPRVLFLRVHAGASAKAGTCRMTVSISADGYVKEIPLAVTVYDLTLPKKSALKVAFSFFEQNYVNWNAYGKLTDEQRLSLYRFIMSYRISPNNIYEKNVYPDTKYLPGMPEANFCTLGYYGPNNHISDADIETYASTISKKIALLKAAGFDTDQAYLYCFDEFAIFRTRHFDEDSVRRFSARIVREFPGIKLMQTSTPDAGIIDLFNVWVTPVDSYELVKPEYRKRAGYEFWWYWVSEPRPFPNFFLGYPAIESRMAMLIGFKYDLPGCLYWCINREWPDNVGKNAQWPDAEWDAKYVNVFEKKDNFQCGQGNLVYPGRNGTIYPSLRFENLRDGIEDFDYLALLRTLAGEIRSGKRAKHTALLAEIDKLLAMPDTVVASLSHWTKDSAVLLSYRDAVAKMIETIVRTEK